MSVIKYIGRKTDFKGKTLWEIVGSLNNFGVGRYIIRHKFDRYPEKSFMKILKVEATPNEETRKVKVTVEKVFRGKIFPRPVTIYSASYKADYQLIPKSEENEYCKIEQTVKATEKLLPQTINLPPLLRELVVEETGQSNPQMKLRFKEGKERLYRIAKDGEKPTVDITMGLGKPVSPNLYEGCL